MPNVAKEGKECLEKSDEGVDHQRPTGLETGGQHLRGGIQDGMSWCLVNRRRVETEVNVGHSKENKGVPRLVRYTGKDHICVSWCCGVSRVVCCESFVFWLRCGGPGFVCRVGHGGEISTAEEGRGRGDESNYRDDENIFNSCEECTGEDLICKPYD